MLNTVIITILASVFIYHILDESRYYMITNQNETTLNGFQLTDGLNINHEFYFRTKKKVYRDIIPNDGYYIREVFLPKDDSELRVIYMSNQVRYANRIFLGKRYDLFDIETVKKFKLYEDYEFVQHVSKYGQVEIFDWMKESGYNTNLKDYLMTKTCNTNTIDWLIKNNYIKKYIQIIDYACKNGCVNVLDYISTHHPKEFSFNIQSFVEAVYNGHINILEWVKKNAQKGFDTQRGDVIIETQTLAQFFHRIYMEIIIHDPWKYTKSIQWFRENKYDVIE